MLESRESKLIVAVVGGAVLAKLFAPPIEQIFIQICPKCGKPLSVIDYFFRSNHLSGASDYLSGVFYSSGINYLSWVLYPPVSCLAFFVTTTLSTTTLSTTDPLAPI